MIESRILTPELVAAVRHVGAIQIGHFTLKSGATSNVYVDMRRLTLSHHVNRVAYGLISLLRMFDWPVDSQCNFDAFGGPATGAIPIVTALMMSHYFRETKGFFVRPAAKDHGLQGLIAGNFAEGDRCVLVEDVVTSGSSLLHAVDAVRAAGGKVVAAMSILDRAGVVRQKLEAMDIPFKTLLHMSDFGLASVELETEGPNPS